MATREELEAEALEEVNAVKPIMVDRADGNLE